MPVYFLLICIYCHLIRFHATLDYDAIDMKGFLMLLFNMNRLLVMKSRPIQSGRCVSMN